MIRAFKLKQKTFFLVLQVPLLDMQNRQGKM